MYVPYVLRGLCCSNSVIFVIFCKQKTAYEVRISDWSSDVCSSDLAKREDKRPLEWVTDKGHNLPWSRRSPGSTNRRAHLPNGCQVPRPYRDNRGPPIGRASWRERVGQYV